VSFTYKKALLKLNVDFGPMVIGADTRDSCSEKCVKGDPTGSEAARRLPNRPLKSERLERKSTGQINRVCKKKGITAYSRV
jgi:hypothetical protein